MNNKTQTSYTEEETKELFGLVDSIECNIPIDSLNALSNRNLRDLCYALSLTVPKSHKVQYMDSQDMRQALLNEQDRINQTQDRAAYNLLVENFNRIFKQSLNFLQHNATDVMNENELNEVTEKGMESIQSPSIKADRHSLEAAGGMDIPQDIIPPYTHTQESNRGFKGFREFEEAFQ